MDWRLFGLTFVTVFLAELGDKTQLATMGFAAQNAAAKWTVFAASALALVLTSLLGVLLGSILARWVDPMQIKFAAAALFIILGIYLVFDAWGDLSLTRYESVTRFLLSRSESECIACRALQDAVGEIPLRPLRRDYQREVEHEARNCQDCSAVILRELLAGIQARRRGDSFRDSG